MTDNVTLLTVREVADLLGVGASTVYALVAARRIRHERIGVGRGTIRIPADAVDEYRASVTVKAAIATRAPVAKPQPAARPVLRHVADC